MAGDGLIAMAVWRRAGRPITRPPADPPHGLSRTLASSHRLEDGTYNVLLLGLCRVRIVAEMPPEKSFRKANADVCADRSPPRAAAESAALHRRMRDAFLRIAPCCRKPRSNSTKSSPTTCPWGSSPTSSATCWISRSPRRRRCWRSATCIAAAELLLAHLSAAAADYEFRRAGQRFSLAVQRELVLRAAWLQAANRRNPWRRKVQLFIVARQPCCLRGKRVHFGDCLIEAAP